MPEISDDGKVTLKLVYYGPAMSGKTTNLMRLHELALSELKGDMMTLETRGDRTLFFDLLPLGFRAPSGLLVKARLYTVPGQVEHDATRKAVLSRADGVVFVADSDLTQQRTNAEAFENLADNAARVGLDFDDLPLVVQFNKRDLPSIVSEPEIASRWGTTPWPLVLATASSGRGVTETFSRLLESLFARLDGPLALSSRHGLTASGLVAGLVGGEGRAA